MDETIDMETGEVIEQPQFMTAGALAQINASEINQAVATAKQFPRNLTVVRKKAYHLITNNQEIAASCIYALPRQGKVIKGPSARFAEIIAHAWGNCRYSARIIEEGAESVTAQGVFYDAESNVGVSYESKRRIIDKDGRRYTPDMVIMTCNAACSVAMRNAILKAIPKAAWQWLYEQAEATVAGDVKTLSERRDKVLALFRPFGMTPAMVFRVIGVEGQSEITTDHLTNLHAILTSLKDGDTTVEQLMDSTYNQGVAEKGERTVETIKRKYRKPEVKPATSEQVKAAQEKLEQKRQEAKAEEPAKVADIQPVPRQKPEAEPF